MRRILIKKESQSAAHSFLLINSEVDTKADKKCACG
jgi:hypothetical protein